MSDFTSGFWSIYISVITVASIIACGVLLKMNTVRKVAGSDVDTTGHVWDEDLQEYHHPLPRWWVWLFYITIVFALVYLMLYPGLGKYQGAFGWSSAGQYAQEMRNADAEYGPLFAKYEGMDIRQVAADPKAHGIGERLFLVYCSKCHASDARGGNGFPNLTDNDWLWGGAPKTIEATIANGRNGVMPALGPVLGKEGVIDVANYVRSLSGLTHDAARAARGKATFTQICAACHGAKGTGNQQIGAPNLTDKIWLYDPSEKTLVEGITHGHNDVMPAHARLLGKAKVHLVAAYVWSLSNNVSAKAGASGSGAGAAK